MRPSIFALPMFVRSLGGMSASDSCGGGATSRRFRMFFELTEKR